MKNPLDLVRAHLLGDTAIVAIVATRIYLLAQPQNFAIPNIIVYPASAAPDLTLDPADLSGEFRISVECRSAAVAEANELGRLATARLHGFQGTIDAVPVERIGYVAEAFLWQDDAQLARRIVDFRVVI